MSTERIKIEEDVLDVISGGSIVYVPDTAGANTGTIGIDGSGSYRYDDFNKVVTYVREHCRDKEWSSPAERDQYLTDGMLKAEIIG